MEYSELKAYTAKIKELEAAIYTQEKLIAEYKAYVENKRPVEPVFKFGNKPVKPLKPVKPNFDNRLETVEFRKNYLRNALLATVGLIGFIMAWKISENTLMGISLMISVLLVIIGLFGISYTNSRKRSLREAQKEEESRYQVALQMYPNELRRYEVALETYEMNISAYEKQKQEYNAFSLQFAKRGDELLEKYEDIKNKLRCTLDILYGENIIFPKYRNLVAITMLNEYLESGRCDALEGANGAYNLYEMELRQNIIVGQLSSIVNNLQQIQSSQYFLYKELEKSNLLVEEIMGDIKELKFDAKLTAYFSEVTALAATAPRYSVGIVY